MKSCKLTLLMILLVGPFCYSQDLKMLDFAPLMKKNRVHKRICSTVKYQNNVPTDTIPFGLEEFDANGRLVYYEEYYSRGKLKAKYRYGYDANGVITRSTVEHFSNDFQLINLINVFDASGRITERKPEISIQNFWTVEKYTYNSGGVLVTSEQFYESNGKPTGATKNNYLPHLKTPDDSIVYIYNSKELMILHRFYDEHGNVRSSKVYSYKHI